MVKVAALVSGGGTNLQAILDADVYKRQMQYGLKRIRIYGKIGKIFGILPIFR